MTDKIRATHIERKAVVYLRQSSLQQVREHRESTRRQYALRERAIALGWRVDAVEVIDEDLGQSGQSADWRAGFRRLAEAMSQGHVGALFALEVSRLARSSADWYRLLELASLADVVIADEDVLPASFSPDGRIVAYDSNESGSREVYIVAFPVPGRGVLFDVTSDGERFLVVNDVEGSGTPITLLLKWTAELKR